jgi:acetylornithine deacetylase
MIKQPLHILNADALALLKALIKTPSLSREENKTADLIEGFLKGKNIKTSRLQNNIWCSNNFFDASKPSILLNSHHDTVPANSAYTNDPHEPVIANGNLFGLGSTDAGASLVCLLAAFLYYYPKENLSCNIVFAAAAEEEISGMNGIEKLFAAPEFKDLFSAKNSFAIVGEPTQLDLAIAEKGLLVLDCVFTGKAGHAAREEGINAIYKSTAAIDWFKNYHFPKSSPFLGDVKMNVTSINTENKAHNIIPSSCSLVVDIRLNELYAHEEILSVIKENIDAEIKPRSMRLRSTSIEEMHPVVRSGIALGKKTFGSPAMSDKALIPLPTLKCGPGNSAQSHTANEFIALQDIEEGIEFYIKLLQPLLLKNESLKL